VSRALHVVHLLDTDQFAGTERHVLLLLTELERLGIVTALACRGETRLCREAAANGLRTLEVFGAESPLMAMRKLTQIVRSEGIDLVHSHNGRTMLMGAVLHRLVGVRAVATQHFLAPQHTQYRGIKGALARSAHHWVNHQTASFIAVSEAARQAMMEREHVGPERIVTIPNGIAPLRMPPNDEIARLRSGFGADGEAPLIVTLARLAPEKGLQYLLRAMPVILEAAPRTRLVLVGDGPQRAELETLAAGLKIGPSVIFAGYRTDATEILAAADLFVLPSLSEPAGLALLEAMCLEIPVIATGAGGPLEIVCDGESGLLAPPADAPALAACVISLLQSMELRRRLGGNGCARFLAFYTAAQMARATACLYQRIAEC
jgi:glycosyltransferase involved in cell wall biosynthesis